MRLTDPEEARLLDYLLAHPKIRKALRESGAEFVRRAASS